jgi:phosphoglycolate phosphatase (TIGR01487 family)
VLKALLTDIDGTVTDPSRRINCASVEAIRSLVDDGIEVVLASGNTACLMDALCKMIGTNGSFIAENGGVFRIGYTGRLVLQGDLSVSKAALDRVEHYFKGKGISLQHFSPDYRFSDRAFARSVPIEEVRSILSGQPVQVIDTGYAIHLQSEGISKGSALSALSRELNLRPADFLAIGDSVNDTSMLEHAGIGVAVANAHPDIKKVAKYVTKEKYGDGFVEAVKKYRSYFRA